MLVYLSPKIQGPTSLVDSQDLVQEGVQRLLRGRGLEQIHPFLRLGALAAGTPQGHQVVYLAPRPSVWRSWRRVSILKAAAEEEPAASRSRRQISLSPPRRFGGRAFSRGSLFQHQPGIPQAVVNLLEPGFAEPPFEAGFP